MPGTFPTEHWRIMALLAACLMLAAANGCAPAPMTAVVAIPPGEARIWVYRDFQPSENLNLAAVSINGVDAGYAQPAGGAFYRDVPPGHYHIAVASYATDFSQSSDVDLAAGQEAFVKVESLSAWATGENVGSFKRDVFYARLIPSQPARAEIAHMTVYGGS